MKPTPCLRAAFTLIELLVVMAIIAILASLLFPVASSAIENGRKTRAKTDCVEIANAVKAYYAEHGRLPSNVIDDGTESARAWFQGPGTGSQFNQRIIEVLVGENPNGLNPRKVAYLEARPAKGGSANPKDGMAPDFMFYDPWGTPYGIKLDLSYDGRIEYYEATSSRANIPTTAVVVSFGPNKVQQDPFKTTDKGLRVDDLASFK